jgi:UDP-N-acetylmuramyl pentapeptide phosphotransferase/UDP-N-acetylglucosamine-1-phosphate transferase
MLEFEGMNYWAVAVAWLVFVAIGSYWYSPRGFGKRWTKYSGVDHMKLPEKEATRAIVSIAISALVQTIVLALIINSLNTSTVLDGLAVGVVVWLGFTAATTVGNTLYQRLGWGFWWLNSSYFLVTMAINAMILTIWR